MNQYFGDIEIDAGDVEVRRRETHISLISDNESVQIDKENWERFFATCVAVNHVIEKETEVNGRSWSSLILKSAASDDGEQQCP